MISRIKQWLDSARFECENPKQNRQNIIYNINNFSNSFGTCDLLSAGS